MTKADKEHIKEALLACYAEFEELMYTKDWYVTSVVDQIESSLEILENIKED